MEQMVMGANDMPPVSVLLLEDDASCRVLMDKYLHKVAGAVEGLVLETKVASTVAEALSMLDSGKFDVIFADLNVPDSLGISTAARLAAHGSKTPIIIVSGVEEESIDKDKLIEMNIVDFLGKSRVYEEGYAAEHNAFRLMLLRAAKGFSAGK